MTEKTNEDIKEDQKRVMHDICKVMIGAHPAAQGAALCEATAVFICGFDEEKREEIFNMFVAQVKKLVPLVSKELAEKKKSLYS